MLSDIDSADVVFVAQLDVPTPTRKNLTAFDRLDPECQKGTAGVTVSKVLRGESAANEGEQTVVPVRIPDPAGTRHLILHNRSAGTWRSYRLSEDGETFAQGAVSIPIPSSEGNTSRLIASRLEYCLRFLGTDDFQVRKAVFQEFSAAPYGALQRLKPRLERQTVHAWMQPASRRAEETRVIFLLLSVCGDHTDLPMLREEFHRCIDSNWAGTLDGVILAYVALGGTEALNDVDQRLLISDQPSIELKRSAANSLKLLLNHTAGIEKPRLLLSCRLLLNDPETAPLVIDEFARW